MSDDLIPKIFEKVEKISEDVVQIKIIAAKHDENLREHMRRTETLEDLYAHLDEDKIAPLQEHVSMMKGIYKFIGMLIGIGGTIAAFLLLRNH